VPTRWPCNQNNLTQHGAVVRWEPGPAWCQSRLSAVELVLREEIDDPLEDQPVKQRPRCRRFA
jgi:hypothetical protein